MRLKAFSLIELVVVILLIGILAGVAVPRLFASTNKAHAAAVQRFQSDLASGLNVLRAEWVMQGQNPIWQVNGQDVGLNQPRAFLRMSKQGFPTFIGMDTTTVSDTTDDMCMALGSQLVGYDPRLFVGLDALQSASPEMRKQLVANTHWLVVSPTSLHTFASQFEPPDEEDGIEGEADSGCLYFYMKGSDFNALVAYLPTMRNPIFGFNLDILELTGMSKEQLAEEFDEEEAGMSFDEAWAIVEDFQRKFQSAFSKLKQEGDLGEITSTIQELIELVKSKIPEEEEDTTAGTP